MIIVFGIFFVGGWITGVTSVFIVMMNAISHRGEFIFGNKEYKAIRNEL